MTQTNLSLIVAYANHRVIGIENRLPWHLPEDLRYFKATTSGHTIIMGRKTYESIGRPLPNRRNIVLTRQSNWQALGCEVFTDIPSALAACHDEQEVFVIGGAELYRQALPYAARVYATEIDLEIEGDATFPELPKNEFTEAQRQIQQAAPPNEALRFAVVRYERRSVI